ncbi:unnamed protein product, partial [Mesorhabditis spiculigera]
MGEPPVARPARFFASFQLLVKVCGLDLGNSILDWKSAKERGTKCQAIFFSITTATIVVILIMEVISIIQQESKTFTLPWFLLNVKLGLAIHGAASAIYMAIITCQGAFVQLEQRYAALPTPAPPNTQKKAIGLAFMFIFTICLMLVIVALAADDTSKWVKAGSPVSFDNLWGADPFVRIISGIFSTLSTIIFMLAFGATAGQLRFFNKELRGVLDEDCNYDRIVLMSEKQRELLSLSRFVYRTFGRLANVAALGAFIAHVDAMAINVGFRSFLTRGEIAEMIGLLIMTGVLLGILLQTPATVNELIQESADHVLHSAIWLNKDARLFPIATNMIERARAPEHKMQCLRFLRLNTETAHAVMFSLLFFGNILAILAALFAK